MTCFCFKSKTSDLYYCHGALVESPEDARPKYGDSSSAFSHADEYFEGNPVAKLRFHRSFEIYKVDT